ncbi:MAG: hypothetical protein HOV77_04260 [Hamadaea sp.]|uniref:hypothetical protein n=1 Tax=Hamadaea sp. TaxID=2024425 RepID=UPI00180F7EE6|nr:hypothetical protein [Hamadaea sp.]NUT18375.1 hypothetical protein [Hamadaea sp.]
MNPNSGNRPVYQALGSLAVALGTLLAWYAWLGWDTRYQVDPVTGQQTGPYETWQVAGCVVTLVALLVCALLSNVRPLAASAALTLIFAAAWTVQAAAADDTGLYAVGAVLLVGGLAAGCLLVSAVTLKLRKRGQSPRNSSTISADPGRS